MRFPYPVLTLDAELTDRWDTYFRGPHDRERQVEEGIWRRTQEAANADQSNWSTDDDGRRRIVHFRYRYDVVDGVLAMVEFYLYNCLTYPIDEIGKYHQQILGWLGSGGWEAVGGDVWALGDLRCAVAQVAVHPEDVVAQRHTPDGFGSLEVRVTSTGSDLPTEIRRRPWEVLAGGMRVKDRRGAPTIVDDLAGLADYLPFQVEVGCGISVEAGIPPLHRLHEIYRVTRRQDNKPGAKDPFVLDASSDELMHEVLTEPGVKFTEFVEMFRTCFLAEPTPALEALRELAKAGHLVGPMITNNFDVLGARAGLDECFVRRYDQVIPDVPFYPEARALLVVGNHADRRKVQARARERGMTIFFLDPEGFWVDEQFAPYPLESATDGDFLCQKTAAEGLPELARLLTGRRPVPTGQPRRSGPVPVEKPDLAAITESKLAAVQPVTAQLLSAEDSVDAYFGGSLMAGLGTTRSDVDLFMITDRVDGPLPAQHILDRQRLDVELRRLSDIERLLDKFATYRIVDGDWSQALPVEDLDDAVRLAYSRPATPDGLASRLRAAMRDRLPVLTQVLITRASVAALGAMEDMFGAREMGDWGAAGMLSRTVLLEALHAYFVGCGDPYLGHKWTYAKLRRHGVHNGLEAVAAPLLEADVSTPELAERVVDERIALAQKLLAVASTLGWHGNGCDWWSIWDGGTGGFGKQQEWTPIRFGDSVTLESPNARVRRITPEATILWAALDGRPTGDAVAHAVRALERLGSSQPHDTVSAFAGRLAASDLVAMR